MFLMFLFVYCFSLIRLLEAPSLFFAFFALPVSFINDEEDDDDIYIYPRSFLFPSCAFLFYHLPPPLPSTSYPPGVDLVLDCLSFGVCDCQSNSHIYSISSCKKIGSCLNRCISIPYPTTNQKTVCVPNCKRLLLVTKTPMQDAARLDYATKE